MVPPIPDGKCTSCNAPVIDLFAEWTDEYQTPEGKQAIVAGAIVFDCPYCQGPLQLRLPLAVTLPEKGPGEYRVAKRRKARCQEWLMTQHPGKALSEIVESVGWCYQGKWAFDAYNWAEGETHHHGQDDAPGGPRS
jgi:hypothetical protein